jgi:DNA polymerase-3 subunit delta
MPSQHVFDFLAAAALPQSAVWVLFGDEPFLKQLARERLLHHLLGAQHDDIPCTTFYGDETQLKDLLEELATVSLFGGSKRRVVLLREADKFVTQHRPQLETYVARPSRVSTFIVEVDSWLGTTKLAKGVEQSAVAIDCRPPEIARGKSKSLDEARIRSWLAERAKTVHGIVLEAKAAGALLELVGPVFGLLDQDLARLALYVPPGGKVNAEKIQEIIGGWRAKSAWDMIDSAVAGETAAALLQLDRILLAGDHPIALFGQIAWSLRRYQAALRIHEAAERAGKRPTLRDSLLAAGFREWPADTLAKAEAGLKQLGRDRTAKLNRWLLDTDLALKGSHSSDERARFALEHLLLKMGRRVAR